MSGRRTTSNRKSKAVLVRMSDIEPQPIRWVWPGRIPAGMLTMLAGDPGLGKSYLTTAIASIVSRGKGWPDTPELGFDGPGGVVLLNAEDSLEFTIAERIDAAGGDRSRIVALKAVNANQDSQIHFDLNRDLDALREAVALTENCRLVIVDPVSAYMGNVDSHKNADVRSVLAPLSALAEETGVGVLAVSHLAKGGAGVKAIYRTMGSIAFVAAARMAYCVAKDPNNGERRVMVPIKSNVVREAKGLGFRIEDGPKGAAVNFDAELCEFNADELLNQPERKPPGPEPRRLLEAVDWLSNYLGDGTAPTNVIQRQAIRDGFSWATVRRARERLPIRASKLADGWAWTMEASEAGQE